MLDLTKILKVGDTVYSVLHGCEATVTVCTNNLISVCGSRPLSNLFNPDGSFFTGGECLLFPSKEIRTWENYCPFKKGDVVLVSDREGGDKVLTMFFEFKDGKYRSTMIKNNEIMPGATWKYCELYDPTKYNL